jgi:hypothetical protein
MQIIFSYSWAWSERILEKPPAGKKSCKTKACVKSKKEDICVFEFTNQGDVGVEFCREWAVLKQCSIVLGDLGDVFPDFVIWKCGDREGEISCDKV